MMTLDAHLPLSLLAACPAYEATPLIHAPWTGHDIWIKDETNRMGLGAFKALGGVYAVARLIARAAGADPTAEAFRSGALRAAAGKMTFICASAGNHGLSVAAGARLFGARSRIHLSATVPPDFEARLRGQEAEVCWSGSTYDESVAAAIADAAATGGVHLADGSWDGYTEPPRLVMEGYAVMGEEIRMQCAASGTWPNHVFLQAGVGGLAAAVTYSIRKGRWAGPDYSANNLRATQAGRQNGQPNIHIVEPSAAPCLQASVAAGHMATVAGPASIMGRLDCKTPSLLAYECLAEMADSFETVSDDAAKAAASLAARHGLPTSPSGAAGLAACLAAKPEGPSLVILSEGPVA